MPHLVGDRTRSGCRRSCRRRDQSMSPTRRRRRRDARSRAPAGRFGPLPTQICAPGLVGQRDPSAGAITSNMSAEVEQRAASKSCGLGSRSLASAPPAPALSNLTPRHPANDYHSERSFRCQRGPRTRAGAETSIAREATSSVRPLGTSRWAESIDNSPQPNRVRTWAGEVFGGGPVPSRRPRPRTITPRLRCSFPCSPQRVPGRRRRGRFDGGESRGQQVANVGVPIGATVTFNHTCGYTSSSGWPGVQAPPLAGVWRTRSSSRSRSAGGLPSAVDARSLI